MSTMLYLALHNGFCLFLVIYITLKSVIANDSTKEASSKNNDFSKKLSSLDINNTLSCLRQDDPVLIELIRNHYLYSPSNLPYNFTAENVNIEGQFGQPRKIAESFDWNRSSPEKRFFLEAGAYDGEMISNTLLFEMKLGWSGLLIEPNPIAFEKLLHKHRKAWAINACISRKPYPEVIEFDMDGISGGIITENNLRPGDLQKLKNEVRRNEKVFYKSRGLDHVIARIDDNLKDTRKDDKVQMQCLPLYSILKAVNTDTVDYLSLDIEGSEYKVLQAAFENRNDWKFNVATIETTYQEVPHFGSSSLEMNYLMKRNGYIQHQRIEEDDVFVNKKFKK